MDENEDIWEQIAGYDEIKQVGELNDGMND